jgi:putative transcriptional regulator
MNEDERYRDRLDAELHEMATGLVRVGAIDAATMREFDALCLTPAPPIAPPDIVELRTREGVSQAVFAACLNVSAKLVSEWERGVKRPSGPSLKLLALVKAKGLGAIV